MPAAAAAIVVLGCALRGDGRPSAALRRRVACGAALFRAGAAPLVVLSGGGRGARPEAAAMRELAIAAGVPGAAMLLEGGSRNTFENAIETAGLLRRRGLAQIILVSDAYHLRRARLLFAHAGLIVLGTAAPPGRAWWRELPLRLREAAALALSLLRMARRGRRRAQ